MADRTSQNCLKTLLNTVLARFVHALLGVFGLCIGLTMVTVAAGANEEQCRLLRNQLETLRGQSPQAASAPSPEVRRLGNLLDQQADALRAARRDAAGFGCVTRSGKRSGGGDPVCPALMGKIGKMEANMERLDTQLKRAENARSGARSARGDTRADERAIRARLQKLRCNSGGRTLEVQSPDPALEERPRKRGFLARLFGIKPPASRYRNDDLSIAPEGDPDILPQTDGGVYRTLCVRVCDGYYYPISFATVRDSFEVDQAICQSSNNATEMRLFFHRNPGEGSEDMLDLGGQRYVDLPNAFLYRTKVVDDKICPRISRPSSFTLVAGGTLDRNQARYANIYGNYENEPPKPEKKPNLFADPDSYMAEIGQFRLEPVTETDNDALTTATETVLYDPSKIEEAGIRVIGPTFLDDRQSVKLLLTPAQIQVQ